MRGMILTAGYGTRLRPLTLLRAKAAVPLLNRPLVRYAAELLRRSGVEEIAVNLHHLPATVRDSLSDLPDITFSEELEILGRGGALKKVDSFLAGDTFIVCNGKIYFEGDVREALADHRRHGAAVTLVVVEWTPDSPFNPVLLHPDGRVAAFGLERRSRWPEGLRPAVFTGVHILEPQVLDRLPEGPSDTVGDLYPLLISEGAAVRGWMSEEFWCESSTLGRYRQNSVDLLQRRSLAGLSESGAPLAGCVVGPRCRLAPDARITESVLWEDVAVGAGARLRRVIAVEGARIPPRAGLRDVVVTPRTATLEEAAGTEVERREGMLLWPIPAES